MRTLSGERLLLVTNIFVSDQSLDTLYQFILRQKNVSFHRIRSLRDTGGSTRGASEDNMFFQRSLGISVQ